MRNISQLSLRRISMPIPPLDEQRRIVGLLEDHLSRLDAAVAQLSQASRRADAMVAASLATHTTSEGRQWGQSTIGAEAELVEYGSSAKCATADSGTDVPVLRMGNLRDGDLDWSSLKFLPATHDEFPKLLLKRGDLLFNRTNSAELVGKSAVFDSDRTVSFASYLIRVRLGSSVNPKWAKMVINGRSGRQYIASVVSQQVGQANVNGTKLKAFPLPLPSREEQDRRVSEYANVVQLRQNLRREIANETKRSALLRRSLLSAAFSGRLTATSDIEDLVSP